MHAHLPACTYYASLLRLPKKRALLPGIRVARAVITSSCLCLSFATLTEASWAGVDGQPRTTQHTIRFTGAAGAILVGTVEEPVAASSGTRPGIVLIQGSGPTDRDGNGSGLHPDTVKLMADALSAEGVVTLRYDKRGQFESPITKAARANLADFCRWSNYVDDAEAALRTLQSQAGVDAKRACFLGHSEGGLVALEAAYELRNGANAPAGLILVSTGGRPLSEILHDQIARLLTVQKAGPEQTRFYLSELSRIMDQIVSTGTVPKDVPAGLGALFPPYIGPFEQGVLPADPAEFAKSYTGPVLILQGAADVQVSATKDTPLLDAALKSRPKDRHTTVIVPNASHNLRIVSGPSDDGLTGSFATPALDALRAWVRRELLDSPG